MHFVAVAKFWYVLGLTADEVGAECQQRGLFGTRYLPHLSLTPPLSVCSRRGDACLYLPAVDLTLLTGRPEPWLVQEELR